MSRYTSWKWDSALMSMRFPGLGSSMEYRPTTRAPEAWFSAAARSYQRDERAGRDVQRDPCDGSICAAGFDDVPQR
jgi:hypothetical protein